MNNEEETKPNRMEESRMQENLAEMMEGVQERTQEQNLDLPPVPAQPEDQQNQDQQNATPENQTDVAPTDQPQTQTIGIINLQSWIDENSSEPQYDNIRYHRATIRGIDPNETIIVSDLHPAGGEVDGHPARKLYLLTQANTSPVLNLPGLNMKMFNTDSYQISNSYIDNIILKCYGLKTGLIVIVCKNINDMIIPLEKIKVSKKDESLELTTTYPTDDVITQKLAENVNVENIVLQYKQYSKVQDEFATNLEAVTWLLERQKTIVDVNHLLQIDNVLINMFSA